MPKMRCNSKDCTVLCNARADHERDNDNCCSLLCANDPRCICQPVPASLPVSGELRDMIAELIHAEYEPEIVALIKSKGLVMLAEDQTLLPNPYNANDGENSYRCGLGYNHGQSDMFHAGWRKIQEEK